jgi:hypothetical protein
MALNFNGLIIGLSAFLIIGIFHPIVIKAEYYYGKKVWPIFLAFGLVCIFSSLIIKTSMLSTILGILGFSSLWSIHEIIEQEKRVLKGWFPANPKKKA